MEAENSNNKNIWPIIRAAAADFGMKFKDLDEPLRLAKGTLAEMERYGVEPEGELLVRLRRFFGMTSRDLSVNGGSGPVRVTKRIAVYRSAGAFDGPYAADNEIVGVVTLDRPSWDDREYVGLIADDETMKHASIRPGDLVIIRRQAMAKNNSIVAAEVDGKTVIRRIFVKQCASWLEAEGLLNGEDDLAVVRPQLPGEAKVRIWGKVVSVTHILDEELRGNIMTEHKNPAK